MSSIPELFFVGETLTALRLDINVVLLFGEDQEYRLRIMEEDFALIDSKTSFETRVHYAAWAKSPENSTGITELSSLVRSEVTAAEVCDNGALMITFEGDRAVYVTPSGHYEAWTLEGKGQILVGLGNGKVTFFDQSLQDTSNTVGELRDQ